jgi:hypothetical protein
VKRLKALASDSEMERGLGLSCTRARWPGGLSGVSRSILEEPETVKRSVDRHRRIPDVAGEVSDRSDINI